MARGLIAGLCTFVLAATASAASAATFTVTGFDDPAGATCGGTTCPSLRAAVTAANATTGSTITLTPGTYTLAGDPLAISRDATIVGAGESATTIKQTQSGSGVLQVSSPTATVAISDLTITGGDAVGVSQANAPSGGSGVPGGDAVGGILDEGGLSLIRVAVTGNRAVGGNGGSTPNGATPGPGGTAVGGIEAAGKLTLDHSAVTANTAFGGTGGSSGPTDGAPGGAAAAGVQVDAGAGAVTIIGGDLSGNASTGGPGGQSLNSGSNHDGDGGPATGGLIALSAQPVAISTTTVNANAATGGTGGGDSPTASPSIGGNGGSATAGGFGATGAAVTVTDSAIDGNTATGGAGGSALKQSGKGGPAAGGGVAVTSPATVSLRRTTIGLNTAQAGAPGANGGLATGPAGGSDAEAGGALLSGTAVLVDVTLAKNLAVGSAGAAPVSGSGSAGSPGSAAGGGIDVQPANGTTVPLPGGSLVLASSTLSANAVQAPGGGLTSGANIVDGNAPVTVSDTIFSAATGSNCSIGPGWTDSGHNLEATSPSQCGLAPANGDLVGVDAQLGQLTDNGGPAPTLALAAASPARGAGGACTDPSQSGNPLLALDERSTARHAHCDIGAYETQPAALIGPVVLAGPAAIGQSLTCPTAEFAGEAPLSFTFTWLRSAAPIAGATSASYTPSAADVGQPISCRVTASNIYGATTGTSNTLTIPAPSGPITTKRPHAVFRGARLRSTNLTADGKGHVSLTVSCPAATPGGKCAVTVWLYTLTGALPKSARATKKRKPPKALVLAKVSAKLAAGRTVTLKLRLNAAGGKATKRLPARVRVVLTSRDAAGASVTHSTRATIRRARRHRHSR